MRLLFFTNLFLLVPYRRPHCVPRCVLFVSVGRAKNGLLVEPFGHNLQTEGEPILGETAGDRNSGNTRERSGV